MKKKISIVTLSILFSAVSPVLAENVANTLFVNLELSLGKTTIGSVIQSISDQTGYEFSYDESILNREISNVSVRVKNERIELVLERIFRNTNISFQIIDNRIFLREKIRIHPKKVVLLEISSKKRGQSGDWFLIIQAFRLSGRISW